LTFLSDFSKNTQISNLITRKIRLMGAELFHADRWTDGHDEANNRFASANAHNKRKTSMPPHERPQTLPQTTRPPGSGIKSHSERNDKNWKR